MDFGGWVPLALACFAAVPFVFMVTGIFVMQGILRDPVRLRVSQSVIPSRGGGVAVVLIAALLYALALYFYPQLPKPMVALIALFAAGIGMIEDIQPLPIIMKIIAISALAAMIVLTTGPISRLPLPFFGEIGLPNQVGWGVSFGIVLVFVYTFTLIDGLTGLAGIVVLLGIALLTYLSMEQGSGLLLVWALVAAAVYGFLLRNLSKSTIYLGDAGSIGLGTLLSGSALSLSGKTMGNDPVAIWIFLIAFLPILADIIYTYGRRLRHGRSVFKAHNRHLYQKLRLLGWTHEAVTVTYAALIIVSGALAIVLTNILSPGNGLALATVLSGLIMTIVIKLMYRKTDDDEALNPASD